MVIDLERLFQALSPLISGAPMDDQAVGSTFRLLVSTLMSFDYVVVFAYRGKERPIDLYSTFDAKDHVLFVSLYQAGPYLLDPFYHAACAPKPGVWRMRELAPDRFFSSEYYRTYYVQTGLAEEVGFFVPVRDQVTVVLSLMRREATGAFSGVEFALLRKVEPLVAALVRHHWGELDRRFDAALARTGRTRRKAVHPPADGVWQHLNLTEREAAIIELVLQGHSSESIGLKLGISTGTVKVHRRNVYRKLGISSQTQLLSLYIKNLGH
ncbi:helix-turn-helix transcriptional regulator [Ensifer aridi]|uniref:helix-turn-helix transcriptional regulator n=1 Tax=Ensifer aridi TaxID=1708715 RepID=UPI0009BF402A|nr:helix-turn-helix transcriptional regulator [Ensifer aridi]